MNARARGMTLIEAMVAAGVLAVGTASLMNLLSDISRANRQASFHASALEVVAKFTSQVSDATCDVLPAPGGLVTDPGLTAAGIQSVPAGTGSLTMIGELTNLQPPMRVQYQVVSQTPGTLLSPPTFQLQLEICDFTNGGQCPLGAPFPGSVYTKVFTINKVCNIRTDASGRGEYFYP